MKIHQLLTTLLALSPGAALAQDNFAASIPEGSATAVKKIAGALCSEAHEPDKPYLVKAGDATDKIDGTEVTNETDDMDEMGPDGQHGRARRHGDK